MEKITEKQAIELYEKWYEQEEAKQIANRGDTTNIMDFREWIEASAYEVEWEPRDLPEWRKHLYH